MTGLSMSEVYDQHYGVRDPMLDALRQSYFHSQWTGDNKVEDGLFMNECIDSTMDHIHVCLLCLLLLTIRGLVVTIGVRFGFLHMEHTTTSRNVLKKRLILASFQLKSTNTL
jgi:hypothetical protein